MSIKLVVPSNHLLCYPLFLLPSISPSIRVFSKKSFLHISWPKYWSFSISPSNEYSGLISFRMDWFDLLGIQGTQESSPTPQFKSVNSSVVSFIVQIPHPYMTTGKTIALTRRTSGKVMSLLYNMLSRYPHFFKVLELQHKNQHWRKWSLTILL